MPCAQAGTLSSSGCSRCRIRVRVQIKRCGGIAGVTVRADLETTDLDSKTAASVEKAIARLVDAPPTASAPHPDMFEYEIVLPERGVSVSVPEHDMPDELAPLIEMLPRSGTIERAPKRTS
jgi:hypothetical protein